MQEGSISAHALVHKFGRNAAVPNGSWAFVNLLGFTAWPLSAATTVRIKAGGNAADDTAGNGARTVVVQGLNDSYADTQEAITTAGTSASSATTASFFRVYRAWVSTVGVYGAANTAAVTIENSAGGTDLIQIGAGEGQSQFGGYSVPAGKTAYLLSVAITADGNKAADFRIYTREDIDDTTAPMKPKRLKFYWDGILGNFTFTPRSPALVIPAKTDIWVEAQGSGAQTEVSADFEIYLVDD